MLTPRKYTASVCWSALALVLNMPAAACGNGGAAAKGGTRPSQISSVAKVAQEAPPVQVLATKLIPQSGQIMYRYNVVNGSAFPITTLTIGYNYFLTKPELRFAPIGWDGSAVPPSSVQSPPGWVFSLIQTDDDSLVSIRWTAANQQEFIKGGKSLAGFAVLLQCDAGVKGRATRERNHFAISASGAGGKIVSLR